MDRKIIYTKFSKTRKKEVSLETSIFQDEKGELRVEKKGNKYSKDTIQGLLNTYKRIKDISMDLVVIPIKQIDEYTVEFPFIQGCSLHELASVANSKEEFDSAISDYIKLLDSIPTIRTTLTKEFENVFGKVDKKEDFLCLKEGILDFNLSNLIKDSEGKVHFIDYEWTYNFPIPKEYILFRALSVLCINTTFKTFYTTEELLNQYILNKDIINQYNSWETHFQKQIVYNQENYQRYLEPNINIDILEMDKVNKSLEEEISIIRIEHKEQKELLREQKEEIEQFRSFKKSKIWEYLTIWRKLKKYFRNFFINIRNDGIIQTFKRIVVKIKHIVKYKRERGREKDLYKLWVNNHRIDRVRRKKTQEEIKDLSYQPLISIVMPVYNVDIKWIRKAIQSIKKQIYTNWEICIADDASTSPNLRKYLKKISKEERIKVVFRKKNGHISEASNSALKLATGEFVALMDNDDYIYPHALAEAVKVLNDKPKTDFIYSDEDKLSMSGKRVEPFFKPDWSPDLFMSTNYLCHLTIIRKNLIDKVGGFRKGFEGSQDYDLYLRLTEETENIEHIPDILYSWRKIPGSTASEYADKNYAQETSIKALEESLKRRGEKGEIVTGLFSGSFRVKYEIVGKPLISIIIPTKDKKEYIERCINSILSKTTYTNYEIIIVDTGTTDKATLDYYDTIKQNNKIKFVYWNKTFNYSAVNNFGIRHSDGEYLLLLNNDTEVLTPDWIEGMLEHAQRKNTGAVGVKLYYPDNKIQHAGVLLGINGGNGKGVAGHAFRFFSKEIEGFPIQKDIIRNYSAVTAACLMVSRKKFEEVSGLEEGFRIAFNDVDFCLKLMKAGYLNVYTPYTELYHHESVSVGTPESKTRDIKEFGKEIEKMYEKWEYLLLNDPYYNKNLTLKKEDFSIALKY